MNLFNLIARFTLDSTGYKKGIDEAKEKNKEFEKDTAQTQMASAISWAAVVAAVLKVVNMIGQAITSTMEYTNNLKGLAQAYGMNYKEAQELNYVLGQVGTSIDSVGMGMKNLANFATSGDKDLTKLVGSVKDANGNFKTQSQLLFEVAQALQGVDDVTERNRLTIKLLGRSYTEFGDFLKLSTEEVERFRAEANELGIVLEDNILEAADKAANELTKWKQEWKSALALFIFGDEDDRSKAEEMITALIEQISDRVPDYVKAGVKILLSIGQGIIQALPAIAEAAAEVVVTILGEIYKINWLKVGLDIIIGVIRGLLSGVSKLFSGTGFTTQSTLENYSTYASYSSASTTTKQEIDVNVTATGDTPLSLENADLIAEALKEMMSETEDAR
jgi:hypothetical protein